MDLRPNDRSAVAKDDPHRPTFAMRLVIDLISRRALVRGDRLCSGQHLGDFGSGETQERKTREEEQRKAARRAWRGPFLISILKIGPGDAAGAADDRKRPGFPDGWGDEDRSEEYQQTKRDEARSDQAGIFKLRRRCSASTLAVAVSVYISSKDLSTRTLSSPRTMLMN